MELKIKNFNYKNNLKNICATFKSGNIYGLYGDNSLLFDKLVSKFVKKDHVYSFFNNPKKRIVSLDILSMKFYSGSIKSEINYYCKINNLTDKSFKKVIEEYIGIFGFNREDFDKPIAEMSYSEKALFYIFINTLFDFDIVFLKNIFSFLDRNNRKKISDLILKLKNEGKIIFVNEKDINILYKISDYLLYFDENKLCKTVSTNDFYNSIDYLIEKNFDIPDKLLFIYLAKTRKNIKLTYLDDVRDIIKDVYKHI